MRWCLFISLLMWVCSQAGAGDRAEALWSFAPLTRPAAPTLNDGGWSRNPIDRFIFRKLAEQGLSPAQSAERRDLVRRVYFDVIGLPPTPDEVGRFIDDDAPDAYARLIDRLLADPRHGEHWARHWLDVVRYAESDGYKADVYRPDAWRYRDYVIDAFNSDKPYHRFVQEQLAGDELFAGDSHALVATGLLRMWPYEDNQANIEAQWEIILADVTDTTAEIFLGLSMGCARCHNHKFDPILQTDYYRFRAFFEPIVPRTDLVFATAQEVADHARRLAEWERATAQIRAKIEAIEHPHLEKARAASIARYPKDMQTIMAKPADQRTPREKQLAYLAEIQTTRDTRNFQQKMPKEQQEQWQNLMQQLQEFDDLKPAPLAGVLAVTDLSEKPPITRVPDSGETVKPGVPGALNEVAQCPTASSGPGSTGRRAALAQWLTRPDNPLASRVIVNRIWHYHFGRGLVSTTSDFGHLGEAPSHPELLDWLATRFVEQGWSIKWLHRLILTSATYRQSARRPAPAVARGADPENQWLWRMNARRLAAEQIRDSVLAISGKLELTAGGPASDHEVNRRSIYLQVRRNTPHPFLAAFDAPNGFGTMPVRHSTTTAPQALQMFNGPWVLERAHDLAVQGREACGGDTAAQVEFAYTRVYGRPPSPEERQQAVAFVEEHLSLVEASQSAGDPRSRQVHAMAALYHVLLNSNEFLYVH